MADEDDSTEMEDDEISPEEEGFIKGADEEGKDAKCRKCGVILMDDFLEKEEDGEVMRFCSDRCIERWEEEH